MNIYFTWSESQGINTGYSGLQVKTEDMAKSGQFILQKSDMQAEINLVWKYLLPALL